MAVCDFVLVEDRATLRSCFPLLDEGVEAIEARCERQDTIAADVFAAVVARMVDLILVRVDEEPAGFMVVYANTDMLGGKRLFVWMLYLRPGSPDVMGDIVEELDLQAREQGCAGIEFSTARPAWERRLAPFGYKPATITFAKEINYG